MAKLEPRWPTRLEHDRDQMLKEIWYLFVTQEDMEEFAHNLLISYLSELFLYTTPQWRTTVLALKMC